MPEDLPQPSSEAPASGETSPSQGPPFPIAGIGASAGGLDAMIQILRHLPETLRMAIVFVQHADPHFPSELPHILQNYTAMRVCTVEEGMRLEPNTIFIPPSDTMVTISGGRLRLHPRRPGVLPIDAFFESLAMAQGGRAVAIVLSGTGVDGSEGLRAVKAEYGITFAQDVDSARSPGMPRSAVFTGAVDFVLPPEGIASELVHLAEHPYILPPDPDHAESLPEGDGDLRRIFGLLLDFTGVDFSNYKQTTLRRRISRRMIVKHMTQLPEYAAFLQEHPEEIRELYRDLLIGVTRFFREPESFEALMKLVEPMLEKRQRKDPIRVWVPGCATGEEAYSIAICLHELLRRLKLPLQVQIFGTDLSETALEKARAGLYPDTIQSDVSAERLERFFVRTDRGFQISKAIRESCIFARQDLVKDPPFSHMDVISCRNVLIYLDIPVQKKVLSVFHYSLNPAGLLMLGSAETVGAFTDVFEAADREHRIHFRKDAPVRISMDFGIGGSSIPERSESFRTPELLTTSELQKRVERVIQLRYSPAGVVVNGDLDILQFRGQTAPFLDPTPGQASLNLLRLMKEDMVVPFRRALRAATDQNMPVRARGLVDIGGERREIDIEVSPISGISSAERYFLVVFDDRLTSPPTIEAERSSEPEMPRGEQGHSEQLQRDLSETREYLRQLTENYQAQVEELQAANEEIRSANEELQSTNEELSTTKEELQSTNEELKTVNEELHHRNLDLTLLNNDLKNLLDTIHIPILMVDNDLRLRRFTAAAERLFDLSAVDIGRPVGHLRGQIEIPQLEDQIREVLQTLRVHQHEVEDQKQHWYLLTVRPYRTLDHRIDGAVISFIDISDLKRSLRATEEARNYAESLIETVREPLVVLDADCRVQRATSAFYTTFQVSREETAGRLFYDLGNGQWNLARLREVIGNALFRNIAFQDFELEHDFPHIGRRTVRLNGRRIALEDTRSPRRLLLAIEDITEQKEQSEVRYRRLFESSSDGIILIDAESRLILDVNPRLLQMTGQGRETFIGRALGETPAFRECALPASSDWRGEVAVRHSDGGVFEVELVVTGYTMGSQAVVQCTVRDNTERVRAARALEKSLREKDVLLREIHHRVKNNLQVVASLMGLQCQTVSSEEAQQAFEDCQNRVRIMSRLHEMLYRTRDFGQIDFAEFIRQIVPELEQIYRGRGANIELDLEPVFLGIDHAIPCGLIVNELITNSLAHGFPDAERRKDGHIRVVVRPKPGGCRISVEDDGDGLPKPFPDLLSSDTLGLKLVDILTRQLRGSLHVDPPGKGARFEIAFPETGDGAAGGLQLSGG